MPRVSYALLFTSLKRGECKSLENKTVMVLPRLINLLGAFPRAVLFRPRARMAMGLPTVEGPQGGKTIMKPIGHVMIGS